MPVSLSRVRTAQSTSAQPCPSKDTSVLDAMENGLRLLNEAADKELRQAQVTAAVDKYIELCARP